MIGYRCMDMHNQWNADRTVLEPVFKGQHGEYKFALRGSGMMISDYAALVLANRAYSLLPQERGSVIVDECGDIYTILYHQEQYYLYQGFPI